jgi:hypothetical protein
MSDGVKEAAERLYVIEVDHPLRGPILVGPWYRSKETCKSWVRFTRSAYHSPTRVRSFTRKQAETIQANGGQQTPETERQP